MEEEKDQQKDKKEKKVKKKGDKKPFFITRSMAEDFSREQVLFSSFIETLIYIVFLVISSIYVTSLKSPSMFYLNQGLTNLFINREFDSNGRELQFKDIATVQDFWKYKQILFESFYDLDYYDFMVQYHDQYSGKTVLHENIILGVPRLRQLRVKKNSCKVHSFFKDVYSNFGCFSKFDEKSEDKSPYGEGSKWTYNKVSRAKSINYNGIMGSYHGGGFAVNFAKNGNNTKELFNQLEEDHWINRNTRIVFVAFSLYNPNLNIFAICKLIFELPPTGGIFTNYKFTTVKLVPDEDVYQFFVMVCEYVFYAFIVFYFLQIIWELIYFKLRFFKHFWSYVDILITILAVTTLILSIIQRGSVKPTIDAIKKKPNEYGNLEYLGDIQAFHNDLCAVMIFLIYIRLFKYLNFNRTMSQLSDTIKKCSMDVLGFSFMFLIVFLAYAELGFLLFGSKVEEFRNLGVSMFTLLRTVLGDFNYPDIEHANANMAPVYFLSYIFLVFFVLLNMFLAIINDTYADVKTEIAIAPTELQMTGYLMRQVKKLLRKCGCKLKADAVAEIEYNETADQIRTALKKCGFTFLEIEMFFSRFNIDPLSSVDENELNKLLAKIQAGGTLSPTDNISEGNYVKVTDFQEQKKQLKLMENTIVSIEKSVDTLLKKIEALK